MKKRLVSTLLVAGLGVTLLAGCGKKEEPVISEAPVSDISDVVVEEPVDTHEGEAKSLLTGEWVDEDIAAQRPVAVMIGNSNETGVLPQHGVAEADIMYEVMAEGGITRLMAIYGNYEDIEQIEPIRSCRLYFLEMAAEYDAIYAHWGQSKYALNALASYEDLDGMKQESYFHRDTSKKAPHNGYTTGDDLVGAIEQKEYDPKLSEDFTPHFTFAEDDAEVELEGGEDALVVRTGFPIDKPWFEYNEDEKLYYRFEYGEPHMDANNDEQAKFKNLVIQYVTSTVMDSSSSTLDIDTVGNGDGYFITNGKAVKITWKKDADGQPTKYYNADSGEEITFNQGKTFISVVNNPYYDNTSIEGKEEEKAE